VSALPVWWEFEYDEWMRTSEPWAGREVSPSVSYDLSTGLGEVGSDSYVERVAELYARCLDAFCVCSDPDEWIYAVDPYHSAFRFWPHRGRTTRPPWVAVLIDDQDGERIRLETFDGPDASPWEQEPDGPWLVAPIPDGDDQLFVAQDFAWGLYAEFHWQAERQEWVWRIHIFGERLVETFAQDPPTAFSHALGARAVAGHSTSPPLIPLKKTSRSQVFRSRLRMNLSLLPLVSRITYALLARRSAQRRRWRSSRTPANARRLRRRFSLAALFLWLQAFLLNRALTRRR
jgi:hypothetical protein